MTNNTLLENSVLELRRGVIVLAVLSQLDQEQYGYSLLKRLSEQGLELDQGTLYPLLRRGYPLPTFAPVRVARAA